MPTLVITPGQLRLEDARRQLESPLAIALPPTAKPPIDASVEAVNAVIREDRTAYGINTGFGLLAHTRIDRHRLDDLGNARWCCPMPPALASRWTTLWCG